MSQINTRIEVKEQSVSAVVTRADGTVEDLGLIAYYHRNPLRRMAYKIRKLLKGH